ncbi:hypothetical protein AB9P05_04360 [Roseivirga sp. BDSF3-8]|uniref:hypothetical protein n=1 Tax=Roseivirga sp. BDSF3-8 TaxID=3241598 RepID=UPI0035327276
MALHSSNKSLFIDSIIENITVIKHCINFKKENDNWEYGGEGILGVPAFILICSVIDAIGSYFRGTETTITFNEESYKIEKAGHHFYILNHEKLFKFSLSKKAVEDFYETYRCKLTHNNSLPENNFLYIGKEGDKCFELDKNGQIQKIYLKPLFKKTTEAVSLFLHYLDFFNFDGSHQLTKELVNRAKVRLNNQDIKDNSITGHTQTIVTNNNRDIEMNDV